MISAKNLFYTYELANNTKINAVENISFDLEKGKSLGIVGKTGSGKSTLVSMLNGLLAEHTGQPIEKIQEDTERDHYLSAQQAMEYGLIDKVILPNTEKKND